MKNIGRILLSAVVMLALLHNYQSSTYIKSIDDFKNSIDKTFLRKGDTYNFDKEKTPDFLEYNDRLAPWPPIDF
ncbi:MAG: hypothetical protein J5802_02485 [Butyrivibrio sp.]|nr:hypothetical protein [Butyrivibrio sp.]